MGFWVVPTLDDMVAIINHAIDVNGVSRLPIIQLFQGTFRDLALKLAEGTQFEVAPIDDDNYKPFIDRRCYNHDKALTSLLKGVNVIKVWDMKAVGQLEKALIESTTVSITGLQKVLPTGHMWA